MDRTAGILVVCGFVLALSVNTIAAPTQTPSFDLYCHVCVDAVSDDQCNQTQRCEQGSGCLTSIWVKDRRKVIQKRCTTKEICSSLELHNDQMCYNTGGVSDGMCSYCCLTQACNKDTPHHRASGTQDPSTPPDKNDNQTPKGQCHRHHSHHRNTGVVTMDGDDAKGTKDTLPMPGLKVSINVEFPNGAHHCGCQDTEKPTHQTPTPTTTPPTRVTTLTSSKKVVTMATTTPMTSKPASVSTAATTLSPTPSPTTTTSTSPTPTTPTPTTPTPTTPTTTKTSSTTPTPTTTTPTPTTTTTPTPPPTTTPTPTTTTTPTPTPSPDPTTTTTPTPKVTTPEVKTTPDPAGPKCYTCKDKACQSQTLITCPSTQPFCMNTLTQDIEGKKTFEKGCASETVCKKEWYTETSGLADCFVLDDQPTGYPGLKLDKCSFCCRGDGCNKQAVPASLWFP